MKNGEDPKFSIKQLTPKLKDELKDLGYKIFEKKV